MAHRSNTGHPHRRAGAHPAAVVTDLDKTLLRSDGTVGARTVAALSAVAELGVRIVFATARPAWSARQVLRSLEGIDAVLLSSNGAVAGGFQDPRPDRVRVMSAVQARSAARLLDPLPWAADRISGRLLGPGWPPVLGSADSRARQVEDLPGDEEVLCLMAYGTPTQAALSGIGGSGLRWTSSDAGLIEVSAPGADKCSAMSWYLARQRRHWDDVIAFGDAPNDLDMLAAAGTGVAVANATPQVLAAATEVTETHDEEGVAQWLERNLL
ncbi:HAD family phosphatase [Streptomyces sp. SDr-06]|uniref:HAD family hydrolase n=1 Tax=Streptomyces sp. SDr-06 TaxID=2267702 RepID=UPI000DE98157|nr:HAD family hydrolase [Streptomyces sp. SDr-06]RCH64200.1 HAD family phosphatase [Streptomyces sp. SDr-06]